MTARDVLSTTGWKTVRTSVAAALNAVKGTAVTLTRRRGYDSVLDHALENMKLLYGDVHSRIDALLKERQRLMRENELLRNEIKRLYNRMPRDRRTGRILN